MMGQWGWFHLLCSPPATPPLPGPQPELARGISLLGSWPAWAWAFLSDQHFLPGLLETELAEALPQATMCPFWLLLRSS